MRVRFALEPFDNGPGENTVPELFNLLGLLAARTRRDGREAVARNSGFKMIESDPICFEGKSGDCGREARNRKK